MALKDIVFGLKLNDGQFKTGIAGARKGLKSLDKEKLTGIRGQLTSLSKSMTSFGKTFSKYGKLAAIGFVGGLSAGVVKGMEAAFEAAQIDAQLKNSLGKIGQGGSFDFLNDLSGKIQKAFVFDDEEVRQGFTTMINAGMKAEQVQKNAALVADVARAKQISYGQAAEVVSKAFNGQLKALKSVGIYMTSTKDKAKDAALAMGTLQSKFGGAATSAAAVMSPLESLKLSIGDSIQLLGEKLIPVLEPVIRDLSQGFASFVDSGQLEEWINKTLEGFKTAKEFISFITSSLGNIWENISGGGIGEWFSALLDAALQGGKATLIALGQHAWNGITNGLPKLTGLIAEKVAEIMQDVLGPRVSKMLGLDNMKSTFKEMGNDPAFDKRSAEIDAQAKASTQTAYGRLAEETSKRFSGEVQLSNNTAAAGPAAPAPVRTMSPQEQAQVAQANAAIQQLNAAYGARGATTRIQLISQQPLSAVAAH